MLSPLVHPQSDGFQPVRDSTGISIGGRADVKQVLPPLLAVSIKPIRVWADL
jgi:hypothetical protein